MAVVLLAAFLVERVLVAFLAVLFLAVVFLAVVLLAVVLLAAFFLVDRVADLAVVFLAVVFVAVAFLAVVAFFFGERFAVALAGAFLAVVFFVVVFFAAFLAVAISYGSFGRKQSTCDEYPVHAQLGPVARPHCWSRSKSVVNPVASCKATLPPRLRIEATLPLFRQGEFVVLNLFVTSSCKGPQSSAENL